MKQFFIFIGVGLIAFAAFYSFTQARNDRAHNTFKIEQPYAFATTENAKTGAAFFILNNQTNTDKVLIEAQSDIAEIVELHENMIDPDDGKMMMRRVKEIIVPAKEETILDPVGYHVMFINLNAALRIGDTVPVTLKFQNGDEEMINVQVIKPGARPSAPSDMHDHSHHNY